MANMIEAILLKNLTATKIRDNTKGFILPNGEYLLIRGSHSSTLADLGLTLKEVLDENVLRFGSFDGMAYIEKFDFREEFTIFQKSCLRDFIENYNIKKIKMHSKIYGLIEQYNRKTFIKIISSKQL